MKTLAIIGSNGMIGSDLVRYLNTKFLITPITKENYNIYIGKHFDIVINTSGNSKRYWANQNPLEDFVKSTMSVYKTILDFPCDIYVYISSSDVYPNHTKPEYTDEDEEIDPKKLQPYGFHKYLGELIVKKHTRKFLILRLSMTLGSNLKKGPFFDIIHNIPLFVKLKTRLQLITTHAVAEIIETILNHALINEIINIGGIDTFAFTKIHKYFNKKIKVSPDAETQTYEMSVKKTKRLYPILKTSEEYLQEFIK